MIRLDILQDIYNVDIVTAGDNRDYLEGGWVESTGIPTPEVDFPSLKFLKCT